LSAHKSLGGCEKRTTTTTTKLWRKFAVQISKKSTLASEEAEEGAGCQRALPQMR